MALEDMREDIVENDPVMRSEDCIEEEKTWLWWHHFRSLCDYNKRIAL
ncbi:hypothetical protein chiPu_0023054, partial [Chiloscyllium punctatum]|nr:hypothetical protein [Chiloscyllium punctatum]